MVAPNRLTMPYAMRLPRPDLMKPPESQNAIAISHLPSDQRPCEPLPTIFLGIYSRQGSAAGYLGSCIRVQPCPTTRVPTSEPFFFPIAVQHLKQNALARAALQTSNNAASTRCFAWHLAPSPSGLASASDKYTGMR